MNLLAIYKKMREFEIKLRKLEKILLDFNSWILFSESKFRKIIFLYIYLNDWHLNETKKNLGECKKDKVIVAWNILPLDISWTLKRVTREKVMKKVSLALRTFLCTVSNTKFKGSSRLSPRFLQSFTKLSSF